MIDGTLSSALSKINQNVVEVVVPPGPLNVAFEENSRSKGVYLKEIRETSPLYGQVDVGSTLISVDGENCESFTLEQVMDVMHHENPEQARILQFKRRVARRKEDKRRMIKERKELKRKARIKKFLEEKNPVKEILVYLVFMGFFTVLSLRGLLDTDIFYFGNNLKKVFTGAEFLEEHSPTWGKSFDDIATVEEYHQWMLGPLTAAAFSSHTFDGDPAWQFQGGKPRGFTLGYGKIIGAVRISQLRVKERNCNDQVPDTLKQNYTWVCYGYRSSSFDDHYESKDPYSDFADWQEVDGQLRKRRSFGPFLFDGQSSSGHPLNNSVALDRKKYLSGFQSRKWNSYQSPAFSITLYPGMGENNATKVMQNLIHSKYIDLQTRAVFVDLTIYNPMLDRICMIRLVAELTKAGGVMTTHEFEVLRLWEFVTAEDYMFIGITVVVFLFYTYYFYEAILEYRVLGAKYFASFLNVAQVLNFVFFVVELSCRIYATTLLPDNVPVDSSDFVDFLPSVQFKNQAVSVKAVNVFLNWFKMIAILSYSPTFGIMTDTLGRATNDVGGFCVVFFIVFFGFAQAYAMIFHGKLEDFRTIGQTCYSLLRALLGDFDFVSLQDADSYMGPVLFIIFVALAMFVVLNMLIAIISDAYIMCQEEMKSKKKVDLMADMGNYLSKIPVFKQCWMVIHACRYCFGVKSKKIYVENVLSEKKIVAAIGKGKEEFEQKEGGETPIEEADIKVPQEDEIAASSYILEEWYRSLRNQDAQFQKLKQEMSVAKQDVMEMRKEFNQAMEMMITQIISKINKSKQSKADASPGLGKILEKKAGESLSLAPVPTPVPAALTRTTPPPL